MTDRTIAGSLTMRALRKVYPGGTVGVEHLDLEIDAGEFVTLLGPSGCGKTTTLRMVAGFETPTSGQILLDGTDMVAVPPHKRPMAMVFQSYALFPHMDVGTNVAFGLRIQKIPKPLVRQRTEAALKTMGLTGLAHRYPNQLSGGQQQRVALARAIVTQPKVLLFDEPLSNLDAKLRDQMRLEIRRLQREAGITSMFVTHDQDEAMTMSDRIVVMSNGRIEQVGRPESIYRHPTSHFVADFIGQANFMEVKIHNRSPGLAQVSVFGTRLDVPAPDTLDTGTTATLLVRPESLRLLPHDPESAGYSAKLLEATYYGDRAEYVLQTPHGNLRASEENPRELLHPGDQVTTAFTPSDAWLIPSSITAESRET